LRVGDEVRTLLGGPGRIVWVGSRDVDCSRHPRPETVWPVRIANGAFGTNMPSRDLFVSPDHAIYVDGVLVPAKHLLNGTTIRQVRRKRVIYYHIELARHDVVLAEGLPAETYLDSGGRAAFSGGQVTTPYPDFTARSWELAGCAPLVITGERLEAARARCATVPRTRAA
jgi:Hint domain